jgi:hypothetical protein
MFTANEAGWDRALRVVLGAVLVYFGWTGAGWLATLLMIVGIVLVATGLIGWCALYQLIGFGTRNRTGRAAGHV